MRSTKKMKRESLILILKLIKDQDRHLGTIPNLGMRTRSVESMRLRVLGVENFSVRVAEEGWTPRALTI